MGQQDSKHVQTMENVLRAIEEIADARVKSLSFDKTIKATIINADSAEKGTYLVAPVGAEQTTTFTAYSENTTYKKDEYVYVTIPEGDMTANGKMILGRYANQGETYYNYVNPLENFLDISGNMISGVTHTTWGLTANYVYEPGAIIWEANNLSLRGYDRLCIKGHFQTWLQSLDICSGTYGLVLTVEDNTGKLYKLNLTTNEMYGNPYYYDTFYLQEAILDISKIEEITAMYLTFAQWNDFYDSYGNYAPYCDDEGNKISNNIFLKAPYISVGYDISEFEGDDLRIYTQDPQNFNSQNPSESRSIYAQWIHVGENVSAVVIDEIDEMPRNPYYDATTSGAELFPTPTTKADLTWFEYHPDIVEAHPIAGSGWAEVDGEQINQFTYTFNTPSGDETHGSANDISSLRYKAIISLPSIRYINFSFTQTEEYTTAIKCEDNNNSHLHAESIAIMHKIMSGEKLFSDGKKEIETKYTGLTSLDKDNILSALNTYSDMRSEIEYIISSELVFPNTGYAPGKAAQDAIASLEMIVDPEDLHGNYFIYDDNGLITDASHATKTRYCEVIYRTFAGVLNSSATQAEDIAFDIDKAECVTWYIPLESTMIAAPVEGCEYRAGEEVEHNYIVEVDNTEDGVPPGKYCKIVRVPQYDNTIIDENKLIAEHQMLSRQHFKIKDYYTQLETNNSIYCRVTKGGIHTYAVGHLNFGVAGTNGTNSTFLLKMFEMNKDGTISDIQSTALSVKTTYYEADVDGNSIGLQTKEGSIALIPYLFDYNNKPVKLTKDQIDKLSYTAYGQSDSSIFKITKNTNTESEYYGSAIITWDKNITSLNDDNDYYLVVEATIPYRITYNFATYEDGMDIPEGKKIGDYILDEFGNKKIDDASVRDDALQTFLPISLVNHKLLSKNVIADSSKPAQVGAGQKPQEANTYQQQIIGANKVLYDRNGSNAKYYKDPYRLLDGNFNAVSEISWEPRIESAKVATNEEDKLPIASFYPTVSPDGILKPLETYIMSGTDPRFCVYGKKDEEVICIQPVLIMQNRYGSPMMNRWDGNLTIDEKNGTILSSMVGAGIKDEHNTFSGVLMGEVSQAYPDNHNGLGIYGFHQNDQSFGFNVNGTAFIGKAGHGRIWFDGNNGTITSGSYSDGTDGRVQQGMQIDLDGNNAISSSIHAFGPNGGFVVDTAKGEYIPLTFKVFTGTYKENERGMIYFDDKGQYIQSTNYNGKYSDGQGPSGLEGQQPPGRVNLINESPATEGTFIDLHNGWIDTRSGIIGGWAIDGNILTSVDGSIILNAGDKDHDPYIKVGRKTPAEGNTEVSGQMWLAGYALSGMTITESVIGFSQSTEEDTVTLTITSGEGTDTWGDWEAGSLTDISFNISSGVTLPLNNVKTNSWILFDDTIEAHTPGIKLYSASLTVDGKPKGLIALNPYGKDLSTVYSSLGTEQEPWGSMYTTNGFYFKEKIEVNNKVEADGWHLCATQEWVNAVVVNTLNERIRQVSNTAWNAYYKASKAIDNIGTWCSSCDGKMFLSSVDTTVSTGYGTIDITFNTGTFSADKTEGGGVSGSMSVDTGSVVVTIPAYSATDINNWEKVLNAQIGALEEKVESIISTFNTHSHGYYRPADHKHSVSADSTTTGENSGASFVQSAAPNSRL